MKKTKFSMNALLIVVILFSAICFFFTVSMYDFSNWYTFNDYYPIEGTDLSVRASNMKTNGIWKGPKNSGECLVEGNFGHDWGVAVENNTVYLNEYIPTDIGMTFCRFVSVDLDTKEKKVLMNDAVLRGRCASGELVALEGYLLPVLYPESNALCSFYSISSAQLDPADAGAWVTIIDPKTQKVLYSAYEEDFASKDFDAKYLNRTLKEIAG